MFIKWVIFIQVNSLSNKNSQLYVINFYTVGNVYTVSLCRSAGQPVSRWSAGGQPVSRSAGGQPVSRWSASLARRSAGGQLVSQPRSPVSRSAGLARRSAGGQPRSPVSRWSASLAGQPVSQPVSRSVGLARRSAGLARRSAGRWRRLPLYTVADQAAQMRSSLKKSQIF